MLLYLYKYRILTILELVLDESIVNFSQFAVLGFYSETVFHYGMEWSGILSVHGADPIAEVKLLISPFLH